MKKHKPWKDGIAPWARRQMSAAKRADKLAARDLRKQQAMWKKERVIVERRKRAVKRAEELKKRGYSKVGMEGIAFALRVGAPMQPAQTQPGGDEVWVPTWVEKARLAKIPYSRVTPCLRDWRQKRALLAELSLLLTRTSVSSTFDLGELLSAEYQKALFP